MTEQKRPERLVVLVADRDIEEALTVVLGRPRSLGIRPVPFECQRRPNRDGGCRANAAEFLRPFQNRFSHALVVVDREGCGSLETREAIEQSVEVELERNGWKAFGKVIVIDPELERWLWSDSPAVLKGLGWNRGYADLRAWPEEEGVWDHSSAKPRKPKAALNLTLRRRRRRRSARVYGALADQVSLVQCKDPAFGKLRTILQAWFPRASDDSTASPRGNRRAARSLRLDGSGL